jgi:hypothetical protein
VITICGKCRAIFLLWICFAISSALYGQVKSTHLIPIKIELAVSSKSLHQQDLNTASIILKNVSGKDLNLKASCKFELYKDAEISKSRRFAVRGDSYWSPIGLLTGGPSHLNLNPEMSKVGIAEGKAPEDYIHLKKHESVTVPLQLNKLYWSASISNVWPHDGLFTAVPKGLYFLEFQIVIETETKPIPLVTEVKSNQVKVKIE